MPKGGSNFFQTILRRFHSDEGGASVSFILTFPIFLWIVAILVQYALIVNAKVLIDFAAQQAARSAVTSLPEGHPENIRSAACMALAPISPKSDSAAPEAEDIYQALQSVGVNAVSPTFPERYTYAMDATTISWTPDIDFTTAAGTETDVKVVYKFRLTVPGAMKLVGFSETVSGLPGHYLEIASTCRVQTSHSRKAASNNNGWPQ